MRRKLQIIKVPKIQIKWLLTGAAFGYFIIHPIIHLTAAAHFFGDYPEALNYIPGAMGAFSVSMLPWSITFTVLSASIGFCWGKIRQTDEEKSKLIIELQEALQRVKTLGGLLPICASCKKIRDDQGYWNQIEAYIEQHSEAEFTHGICPQCARKLYPDFCD